VLTKPDGADQTGKQRFNYLFYIDFVGALSDPVCQNALRHLQVRLGVHAAAGCLALLGFACRKQVSGP
jgi:prephenate dehydratase